MHRSGEPLRSGRPIELRSKSGVGAVNERLGTVSVEPMRPLIVHTNDPSPEYERQLIRALSPRRASPITYQYHALPVPSSWLARGVDLSLDPTPNSLKQPKKLAQP